MVVRKRQTIQGKEGKKNRKEGKKRRDSALTYFLPPARKSSKEKREEDGKKKGKGKKKTPSAGYLTSFSRHDTIVHVHHLRGKRLPKRGEKRKTEKKGRGGKMTPWRKPSPCNRATKTTQKKGKSLRERKRKGGKGQMARSPSTHPYGSYTYTPGRQKRKGKRGKGERKKEGGAFFELLTGEGKEKKKKLFRGKEGEKGKTPYLPSFSPPTVDGDTRKRKGESIGKKEEKKKGGRLQQWLLIPFT